MFDTHAHLDQPEFDADRPAVIERAKAAGVTTMLAVGITADSSRACVDLAVTDPAILAAVGIQPNYCGQAADGDWDEIVRLAAEPGVVALGETGLDRHWDYTPFQTQQDYFDRHLRLSQALGLPFIVHTRVSDADVLAMLREAALRGPLSGVMHSFTGSAETAAECLALGLYISFAGMVTFKNAADLRAVARTVPADRLLIETDSPYLSPHPLRGRRNEPAHLVHTAVCLAAERDETPEEFGRRCSENARRLFRLGA
jgi:TatD DNase family protein